MTMKILLLFLVGLMISQSNELFGKNYYLKGETRTGTFYLYCQSQHDSLDYIKLYDSKSNLIDVDIQKSVVHFSPPESPDLRLIKLDYTFNIPLNLVLTDSLVHFEFRTRQQHNITSDYSFFILTNKPVSDLKIVYPIDAETDVDVNPEFRWTEESHPAIRQYRFQLSLDKSYKDFLLDTIIFINHIKPKIELESNTEYFWQLRADFEDNEKGYLQSSFSTGAKTTWSPFSIDKYHYAQDIQRIDSNRLILVDHQIGFQISDDNGTTWNGRLTKNIIPFKLSQVIDGNVYATAYDLSDERYKILKSSNNADNWNIDAILPSGNPYQTDKKMKFIINPKDEFVLSFINRILKYDNIETKNLIYEAVTDTSYITGFVELGNSSIVAVSESRYVVNETDKGDIFIISNNGMEVRKVFSDYDGQSVDFCSINLLENGSIIASGIIKSNNSSIYLISEDGGETWNIASKIENSKLRSTISTFDGYLISNYYDNPNLITLSKDYGKSWINISGNLPANYTAYDIKIVDDSLLYYLSNSNILYRTNIRSEIELSVYPTRKVQIDSEFLEFGWKKNRRAEKYNIQVSLNADFERIGSIKEDVFFVDQETIDNKFQLSKFDPNTSYYWRVRPYYEGKWMNWYESESFEVTNNTDVAIFDNYNIFNLYPSPTDDFITIQIEDNVLADETSKIQLFDMFGLEVQGFSDLLIKSESTILIDVSHLSAGVYFVKIGDKVQKLVKI